MEDILIQTQYILRKQEDMGRKLRELNQRILKMQKKLDDMMEVLQKYEDQSATLNSVLEKLRSNPVLEKIL